MFLLGYVATRRGLFPFTAERRRRLLRPARVAFGLAGIGSALAAAVLVEPGASGAGRVMAIGVLGLLAPFLSFAMVVGMLEHAARRPDGLAVRILAVVGRNSLSGYILHSALLGAVFFGWGFGLRARPAPLAVLGVAILTFAAIAALLQFWTRAFRYGPAEWIHRSFTDLRWKPLFRSPAHVGPRSPKVS